MYEIFQGGQGVGCVSVMPLTCDTLYVSRWIGVSGHALYYCI